MTKHDDDLVLKSLQQRHGTIVIDNPGRALLAVGEENSQLHEEMTRCHAELDIYRNALTVIAYVAPDMVGGVGKAFAKCQQLARAALAQLVMGGVDLQLLTKVHRRQREESERHGRD